MNLLIKISCVALSSVIMQVKTCSISERASLETSDYVGWIENPENGVYVSKEVNGLIFSLQYKPLEYEVMLQEKRAISALELAALKDSISDMQYYTFRIATTGGSDVQRYDAQNDQDYYARLEYFALEMQNDLQLIDGADTLPCRMFHFERTYGIDPRATFVLAFDAKGNTQESKTLIYTDHAFNSGPILLTIESTALEQIPELHLSE